MDIKPLHKPIAELNDTDLCVLCGMCLPYCPTYAVYQNEAESPRGRISLIQAYARGQLAPDDRAWLHLDHCLGCMACEAMCPSRVPYGRLLHQAKSLLDHPSQSFVIRRILRTNTHPTGASRFATGLSLLKQSGIAALGKHLPIPEIQAASRVLISSKPARLNTFYPSPNPTPAGSVLLFTGCMGTAYDSPTLHSTIRLLNHYGFDVHVPHDQYCCGALHLHHGDPLQASTLEKKNIDLFERLGVDHVIYTSNGCGAHLQSYSATNSIMDISHFLMHHSPMQSCDFHSLNSRVMIHESCSTQNKLKTAGSSRQLLEYIPGIETFTFRQPSYCCGAGGGHLISYPELASQLLDIKLTQIQADKVKYLVSDNIGCSLHYKSGLAKLGSSIEVIHPVTLLARQLNTQNQE